MKDLNVELKVCEGCGALYLRQNRIDAAAQPREASGIYCRGCERWLSEFPAPERRSRRGRKPKGAPQRTSELVLATVGGAR
jgi:hypothetical protein